MLYYLQKPLSFFRFSSLNPLFSVQKRLEFFPLKEGVSFRALRGF